MNKPIVAIVTSDIDYIGTKRLLLALRGIIQQEFDTIYKRLKSRHTRARTEW